MITDSAGAAAFQALPTSSAPLWTSEEIATATGGTASAAFVVHGVAFDSREVGPGDLFIAMRGEHTDGNRFVDQAFAAGASGAIVDNAVPHPHVLVADAAAALEALGRASRARSAAMIIGVTGSVGKTGTKEAIAAALDRHAPGTVHRSVKSYNNHTGVPLSLARMPRDARYGVFEMGMNHAGEIAALTAQVRPHIAVITAIAPAHIENLGSMAAIADAKAEIFIGLENFRSAISRPESSSTLDAERPADGIAIIPSDSPWCARLADGAASHGARVITFGTGEHADVRARDWVADLDTGGTLINAELGDAVGGTSKVCFALAQPGEHWVSNAMAVIAVARAAGASLAAAGLALAELPGLAGRGARHQVAVNGGTFLLIDESYNANPASMAATLSGLAREPATRRIAVLGAMKELGSRSDAYHAALAEPLLAAGVDHVLLVGEEMTALATALAGRLPFAHGDGVDDILADLVADIRPGDAVLVKGSNSVGLSRVITALTGGDA